MSDKPVKFYSDDKAHKEAEKLLQDNLQGDMSHKKQMTFDGPDEESSLVPDLKEKTNKPLLKRLFWPSLSAFVVFAAGFEAYQFIAYLLEANWLLGAAAGALGAVVVASGAYGLFKGWKARRRLKKRQKQQQQAQELLLNDSYGQADALLADLNQEIGEFVSIEKLQGLYEKRKQQVHNDQELIQIYSNTVLNGLDKMALDVVTKHATEAAAMVALSPLAAVDMALVAWRGSKMIEQLSQLYGCPQTALGRLEMTKTVFKNMMLAGASELVADAGVELLGKSLTATISTKAAQGIGVGLLVARMGIQTMHLCRPVPFEQDNKPKLSHIRKSVYQKVVSLVKNASTGKADNKSAIEKEEQGNSKL